MMATKLVQDTITNANIAAVIIAAGYSSRMHAFKPLLLIRDKTFLETTVATFTGAGITDIVVVVGHQSELLIPLIEVMHLKWVLNSNYQLGMFSSVQTGAAAIAPTSTAFFTMPVDVPLVKPETIQHLVKAFDLQEMDVLYPSFEGNKGHPPLISAHLIPELLSSKDEGGLKVFLQQQAKPAYLNVSDPGILVDIDTQESYERLIQSIK